MGNFLLIIFIQVECCQPPKEQRVLIARFSEFGGLYSMIILNKENLTQAWEWQEVDLYFISVRKISFFLAIWKWTFHILNVFWKVKVQQQYGIYKNKKLQKKRNGNYALTS
jgi:hypothetical protein